VLHKPSPAFRVLKGIEDCSGEIMTEGNLRVNEVFDDALMIHVISTVIDIFDIRSLDPKPRCIISIIR